MLSTELLKAMNDQIRKEIESAYLYLSMAAHFEAGNWPGFAQWMKVQNQEEWTHAMKFFEFIHTRGGRVTLLPIAQPPSEFKSHLAIFEQTLAHEKQVTASIHRLYEMAIEQKDYASQVFLQWFVNEQVEEEKNAAALVETLKAVGDKPSTLIYLDKRVGDRKQD
jgi:ferritin